MADWDLACPDPAKALTRSCIPTTALLLMINYRNRIPSIWRQFGSRDFAVPDCRHSVTRHETAVVVVQPGGSLGTIGVRLRPEAAASLLGERLQCFLDAIICLDDLFGAGQVSLLEEMLSEARTSAERFACVERFLVVNLRPAGLNRSPAGPRPCCKQNLQLRVSHLAAAPDVSQRQLSWRFQAMFGTSPKQFARIARVERA